MDTPNPIQSPPFTLLFSHLLIHYLLFLSTTTTTSTATIPHDLTKGFTSTPDPTVTNFQPLLTDHTGNYSLSFLRVNVTQLALTIIHVPSGLPLWQPGPAHLARWGPHTQLLFNGTLVLTDPTSGVFWSSTHTTGGDQVSLTNSSNLQIWRRNSVLLWQSFDFPYNTLMENQNFTSAMHLVTSNGLYTMRLGPDFIGLYAKFKLQGGDPSSNPDQIYFRHRALQAKANILVGHGPVQVRISSDGFLGMYQNGSVPADVQPFKSYLRSVPGPRRVRIESDGNLKGYYWSGSGWELDYQAIRDPCDLPSPCGPYGLCQSGGGCSCLDNNKTQPRSGECNPTRPESGDFCGRKRVGYRVLRRTNVELPFKDLMVSTRTSSYGLCESLCANNCTCWGALYNNGSGLCYTVDYPIETMVEVGDESKMGYFKVWEGPRKKGGLLGFGAIGIGLLCGGIIVLLISVLVIGGSKLWKFKNRKKDMFLDGEDIVYPGHYKDLGSQSFGSIELSGNR